MSNMSKTIAILGVVAGLGVAALPLSTYAAPINDGDAGDLNTEDGKVADSAVVKLTVDKKLSIELSGKEADLGDGKQNPTIDVTVVTNNTLGYDLKIAGTTTAAEGKTLPTGADATSLVNDNNIDFIKAGDLSQTYSTWGYKVAASTDETKVAGTIPAAAANWAGVTADGTLIMSSEDPTLEAGQVATVTFGADVKDGAAAGTYTGTVTFTASDKTK